MLACPRQERTMADILELFDLDELRHQVRQKYRDVAADLPTGMTRNTA